MDMRLFKFDIYQGGATIALRAAETLDVLLFSKKRFCMMSGQKFTLSDATSLLPNDLSGFKYIYIYIFRPEAIT